MKDELKRFVLGSWEQVAREIDRWHECIAASEWSTASYYEHRINAVHEVLCSLAEVFEIEGVPDRNELRRMFERKRP